MNNTTATAATEDSSSPDPPPTINTNSREYLDEQASLLWEERFQELQHFEKGHGHCRVPVESGALGKWVMHLREKYKRHLNEGGRYRGQLTAERIGRLTTLGFEWSVRPPTIPWEERFAQLQEFHATHGHTRVKKAESAFGDWVQRQRKLARAGKLSQERLQLLQTLNFEERIVPTNKTWEESFELLLEFRRENGHAHVPKPTKSMAGDEHSLSIWADRQRMYYHTCFLEKKPSTLNKKRVKQLNELGFDWGSHRTTQSQQWSRRFTELQQYRLEHGDCNVPAVYAPNKSLGRWVSEQRSNFNKKKKGLKSSMTTERQLALESIGFQWKRPKKIASRKPRATKPHPPIAPSAGVATVDTAGNHEDGKLPAVDIDVASVGAEDTSRVVQEAVAAVEAAHSGEAVEMDLLNVGETALL